MKIDVSKLKEGQTEVFQEAIDPSNIDINTDDVKFIGNIDSITEARKERDVLYAKTHLKTQAEFVCCRCLKQIRNNIDKEFNIEYSLDEIGNFIDVAQNIREELILEFPVKFLCKESCQGICPKCGMDLNEGKCNCQMRTRLTER